MLNTNRLAAASTTFVAALAAACVTAFTVPASASSGREVTDALIWVGASERVARRSLGNADRAAIRTVERRLGSYADGRLDAGEMRALLVAAERVRAQEGYRIVTDPATGARIGLPTAWLGARRDAGSGSAWASPDGAIAVETFALDGGLDAFERAERRRGVDVTYAAGRERWRVVTGYAPGGMTVYARAVPRGGRAIGFRVTYERALAGRLDRVAVAMSSDFRVPEVPVPSRSTDALAYAPPRDMRDDGRFEPFEPFAPSYAALPRLGPIPRERPVVASLGRERAVPGIATSVVTDTNTEMSLRDLPLLEDVGGEGVERTGRAPADTARRPATPAPLSLDDDADALALDPARGAALPDDDETEGEVPATITGLVTDEGQSCPTLRGSDGTLYALVGEVPSLAPGTLVSIEAVGVDTTRCSAGRTVAVGGLQVRSTPR